MADYETTSDKNNKEESDKAKYDARRPKLQGLVDENGDLSFNYDFTSFKAVKADSEYSLVNTAKAVAIYKTLQDADPSEVSKMLTGKYGLFTGLSDELFDQGRQKRKGLSLDDLVGYTLNNSKPMSNYLWEEDSDLVFNLILQGNLYKSHQIGDKKLDEKFNEAVSIINDYSNQIEEISKDPQSFVNSKLIAMAEKDPEKAIFMSGIDPNQYLSELVGFREIAQIDAIEMIGAENLLVKNLQYGRDSRELEAKALTEFKEKDLETRRKLGPDANEASVQSYIEERNEKLQKINDTYGNVNQTFGQTAFTLASATTSVQKAKEEQKKEEAKN